MTKLAVIILVSIAIATIYVDLANAICCNANSQATCNDGSEPTPCCGRGQCNFFCCNCDRGCWGRRKRDVSGTGLETMDKNGDGHVDKNEAHAHLLTGKCGNYTEKIVDFVHNFNKLDKDGDGKLSRAEIGSG